LKKSTPDKKSDNGQEQKPHESMAQSGVPLGADAVKKRPLWCAKNQCRVIPNK
jgi:hypothetical protein